MTTILDPTAAPAVELASLYGERWKFETTLDELKTHQRGPRVVLRSKGPDGVCQEVHGHRRAYYAIRALMTMAATDRDSAPIASPSPGRCTRPTPACAEARILPPPHLMAIGAGGRLPVRECARGSSARRGVSCAETD